jgi:hypothetical protein
MQGPPEVYAFINLTSENEIMDFLSNEFGRVRGVDRIDLDIVLDVKKFVPKFAMIRTAPE